MKWFIIPLTTFPALLVIGVSLTLMERVTVILCGVLACVVSAVLTCGLLAWAYSKGQRLWPLVVSSLACLALILSVVTTHWPVRAAYLVSRPSLDRLARDVRGGRQILAPTQAGLFTIRHAEMSQQGMVCLWVDPNPAGKMGFVQCRPDSLSFNLWSRIHLDNRWQLIAED